MNTFDIDHAGTTYTLMRDDVPVRTAAGHPVTLDSFPAAHHLLMELSLSPGPDPASLSAFGCFCLEKDEIAAGADPVAEALDASILSDPLARMRGASGDPSAGSASGKAAALAAGYPGLLSLSLGTATVIHRAFLRFIDDLGFLSLPAGMTQDEFLAQAVRKRYAGLSATQRSCINLAVRLLHCGILVPMLFAEGYITAGNLAVWALGFDESLTGPQENVLPEKALLDHVRHLQQNLSGISQYLLQCDAGENEARQLAALIGKGEHDRLEFKSTLRWNLRDQKKDPAIEHASLKTVCAFLNSDGGSLLIGVRDDGTIEGIETDGFENTDRFSIHLWNLIKSQLGEEFSPYIQSMTVTLDGKTVCRVLCMPAPSPVFLQQKGQEDEFFVRTGPSTTRLGVGDAYKYIRERFPAR